MKRNKRPTIPSRFILFFLAMIAAVLLFISYTTGFSGGPLRTVAEYVFVPMQKGLDAVGNQVSVNAEDAASREELLAENEQLRQEVETLQSRLTDIQLRQSELDDLRALYELDQTYGNYDTTGANVIGRGGNNWFDTFTIDKGSEDGITEDMNVIADGGLIGIVTNVGAHHALVRSVIDDTTNISGQIVDTEDYCIVSGSLETMTQSNMIEFSSLEDEDDAVSVGDAVVTSNISDKYVPGLLIGYISEISADANGLTKSGKVAPVADFKHLSDVLVILQVKETGE